ncbi:MAG: PDZ domain-containing protein [Porphyromonadaceae bacterium]|nr:MAG: PDZ domain-containing protein [Porphyromonadaceae bacterium]
MNSKRIFGTLLIAIVGSLIGIGIYSRFDHSKTVIVQKGEQTPVQYTGLPASTFAAPDFRLAAEKSIHAVVHVKTVSQVKQYGYDNIQDWFFGNPRQMNREMTGYGSGVIIDAEGHIITNNHVIEGSNSIEVTLNDGRVLKATIVGRDPQTDVAVIKIKADDLQFLTFGNSNELQVGDWVLAVGNPFNLTSTVTAGIVSAKGRNISIIGSKSNNPFERQNPNQAQNRTGIESFIQTDAAVNPGNSGGALVNLQGELVGINTAIASQTGSYTGYSFAIPVTIVRKVVSDIIEFGEVQRVVIGIQGRTVTPELVDKENLKVNKGVYVTDLTQDGGALKTGLKSGDVIIGLDGAKITSMGDLQEQIVPHRPGDKVIVMVDRKGDEKEFTVILKTQSGDTKTVGSSEFWAYLGADLEKVSDKDLEKLNIDGGVRVTKIHDGKFKDAGIPEGFVITNINRAEVQDVQDVRSYIERITGGVFIEGIGPDGKNDYYFRK